MKIVVILFFLTLLGLAKEAALVEKKTDFLRVRQNEKSAHLQTAITTYEKDGTKIALIGAIHIADKSYYESQYEIHRLRPCPLRNDRRQAHGRNPEEGRNPDPPR